MSIGASLFLLAVGAILTWGVHVTNTSGFDINTIGMILMVVGLVGLVLSFLFWSSFAPYGGGRRVVRDDYVDDAPRRRVRREIVEDV
jgi:hypothetical protein